MKSSCCNLTACGAFSPLATCKANSINSAALASMVSTPVMIVPVSMSITSFIRCVNFELLDTLIVGAMGFPVGVPNPVVNNIMVQPEPANAVVDSTSLPGVHNKCNPGLIICSV